MQGTPQEPVNIEDGDSYSKVIKRVVLKSDTQQSEVRAPSSAELVLQRKTKHRPRRVSSHRIQFDVVIIFIVFVWFFSFLCCISFIVDYSRNPRSYFKRIKSIFWPGICREETVSKCTAVLGPHWLASLPRVTFDMCLILKLLHLRVIKIII